MIVFQYFHFPPFLFLAESLLCVGDHVSWHSPLDGSESRVQHMLMSEDPQLGSVSTPNGTVQFVQVVGITSEELRAVQHWNGAGVLDILRRSLVTGGPWLVLDMRRGESMYELEPSVVDEVEAGIEEQGSNLSGVSAKISWVTHPEIAVASVPEVPGDLPDVQGLQIRSTLKEDLMGTASGENGEEEAAKNKGSEPAELLVTQKVENVHLTINLESGALLPLALRGRLKHDRHFTFKSVLGPDAVTLIAPGVSGSFVSSEAPFGMRGPWLQLLIPHDLIEVMSKDLAVLADPDEVKTPVTYQWPTHKLALTVIAEDV